MTPEPIRHAPLSGAPRSPLDDHLGVVITEASADGVVARLDVDPDRHVQPYGIVHGGVYCAMAETVASIGGALAASRVVEGAGAVGQSNHTDFLRATRSGGLTARATPTHIGRSVQLWGVDIHDDDGRLVAQSTVRLFNVGIDRLGG